MISPAGGSGEGAELYKYLRRVCVVPEGATWFELRFELNEVAMLRYGPPLVVRPLEIPFSDPAGKVPT